MTDPIDNVEEVPISIPLYKHHPLHDITHPEIQMKAYELYKQAVEFGFDRTGGVDPGPWFFWFKAERILEWNRWGAPGSS